MHCSARNLPYDSGIFPTDSSVFTARITVISVSHIQQDFLAISKLNANINDIFSSNFPLLILKENANSKTSLNMSLTQILNDI
jgi:hypothetical protein